MEFQDWDDLVSLTVFFTFLIGIVGWAVILFITGFAAMLGGSLYFFDRVAGFIG